MAREVGDLWPTASGSASLGAEMRNGGLTGAVRPFGTVHLNSGIFYDAQGMSGVIRYAQSTAGSVSNRFELSLDGGVSFPILLGEIPGGGSVDIVGTATGRPFNILSVFDLGLVANASVVINGADILGSTTSDISLVAGRHVAIAGFNNIVFNTSHGYVEINSVDQIALLPWGGSGALNYRFGPYQAWYWKASHSSTGGPFNDGYWPIPHSGNVAQMIKTATDALDTGGSTVTSLDGAYANGNIISLTMSAPEADVASANYKSQPKFPVVVKHVKPGAGINTGHDKTLAFKDASIIASGYTLTPNVRRSFAWSAIGPGYVAIQGSGSPSSDGGHMILESLLGKSTTMTVSGTFALSSTDGVSINVQDDGTAASPNISLLTTATGRGIGGQISFSPFGGSGALEYRFGPHQAWYVKSSHASTGGPFNDGYWPVANSGQVSQMITQGVSLQTAYNNGGHIVTQASTNGAVSISGVGAYDLFLCVNEQDHAHIWISGVSAIPVNGTRRGSFWLQAHTGGVSGQFIGGTAPTSYAVATARSLGIDTFFLLTGSGVTSLRSSSGVAQFYNNASTNPITELGLVIPIDTNTTADQHFGVDSVSGITTFVSGRYRISYVLTLEKTAGNLCQMVTSELRLRDKWGQAWKLLGSDSASIVRDSNKLNVNAACGQWMGDIRAGETLQLFAAASEAPYSINSVRGFSKKCNVIVEWMGPMNTGGSTRLAM